MSSTCAESALLTEPSICPGPPGLHLAHTHRDENTLGISTAALNSEYTFVVMQHKARSTDTALFAGGGGFWDGAPTEAFWV